MVQLATRVKRKTVSMIKNYALEMNGLQTKYNLDAITLGSYEIMIGMDCIQLYDVLMGKANFLHQFVPNYSTWAHGFMCLLRKYIHFQWYEQAQSSFEPLKKVQDSTPLISPPAFEKYLILYISMSPYVVGSILVQQAKGHNEHPIYYNNKKLEELAHS